MPYAIYQPGHAIFGMGATQAEAWEDARRCVDQTRLDDSGRPDISGLEIAECSERTARLVMEYGGDLSFSVDDGVLEVQEPRVGRAHDQEDE